MPWRCGCGGIPRRLVRTSTRPLHLAQHLAHPFSLARTLHYDTILCQLRRETLATRAQANEEIAVATAQNFALAQATGRIMSGWANGVQDHSPVEAAGAKARLGVQEDRPLRPTMAGEKSGLRLKHLLHLGCSTKLMDGSGSGGG